MKNKVLLLVIGLVAIFSIGTFAITVVTLGGWVSSPVEQQAMESVVKAFNQKYAGQIELQYQPIPGDYLVKLTSELSAGTAPDIFYLDSSYAQQFIRSGAIYPLDYFIQKYNFPVSDFATSLLQPFEYNGHIYGFPKDFSTLALFYNKDLFDKYGVPYPTNNWTWQDLLTAAQKLNHPEDGVYGLSLSPNALDRVMPFIFQNDGEVVNSQMQPMLNTPQDIQAIQFYFDLHNKYHVAIQPSDVGAGWNGDAFGRGKVAMIMEGPWAYSFLKETYPQINFGMAVMPMNKSRATMIYTVCYAMSRSTPDKEAAWKVMEFLLSDGMKVFTEKLGVIPTRFSVQQSENVFNNPADEVFVDQVNYGHGWFIPTANGNSSKLLDNINSELYNIWQGKVTVQQAVDYIVNNWNTWSSQQ